MESTLRLSRVALALTVLMIFVFANECSAAITKSVVSSMDLTNVTRGPVYGCNNISPAEKPGGLCRDEYIECKIAIRKLKEIIEVRYDKINEPGYFWQDLGGVGGFLYVVYLNLYDLVWGTSRKREFVQNNINKRVTLIDQALFEPRRIQNEIFWKNYDRISRPQTPLAAPPVYGVCQLAEKIIAGGGDYILALKGNQGNFHAQVKDYMDTSVETYFEGVPHEKTVTIEKDHGRVETREYYLINELDWLDKRQDWHGLNSVGVVVSKRTIQDKTTTETRLYISSLKSNVKRLAEGIRNHWGVKSMHWSLDISFQEDQCRKRTEKSAANFAIIRQIALNLLKKEQSFKGSIVRRQFKAALTEEYLEKVLQC